MSEVCPVDGCSFGDDRDKTWQQVAQHIRMTKDDDHSEDPSVIRNLNDGGDDASDEESTETVESNTEETGTGDANPGEEAEESTSSDDNNDDSSKNGGSSVDELQRQREKLKRSESDDDDSSKNDVDEPTSDEPPEMKAPVSMPSFDTRTLLIGLAILLVVATAYLYLRDDDDESDDSDEEPTSTGDEEADGIGGDLSLDESDNGDEFDAAQFEG